MQKQEKRVNTIQEIDFSDLKMPMIAVYKNPVDFPNKCVARVHEQGKVTDTLIVKNTLQEIIDDIMTDDKEWEFLSRGKDDVYSLVGVWVMKK